MTAFPPNLIQQDVNSSGAGGDPLGVPRQIDPVTGRFRERATFTNQGGLPTGDTGNFVIDFAQGGLFQLQRALATRGNAGQEIGDLFAQSINPLREALANTQAQRGQLSGLTDQLTSAAVAQNAGAGAASVQAARIAGGGRGGLAFSGGAAEIGRRGAAQASIGTSAALSNALIQGRLAEAQFNTQQAGAEAGIQGALSASQQQIAAFRGQQNQFDVNLRQQIAAQIAGLSQPGAQVASSNEGASAQRNAATKNLIGSLAKSSPTGEGGFL